MRSGFGGERALTLPPPPPLPRDTPPAAPTRPTHCALISRKRVRRLGAVAAAHTLDASPRQSSPPSSRMAHVNDEPAATCAYGPACRYVPPCGPTKLPQHTSAPSESSAQAVPWDASDTCTKAPAGGVATPCGDE